MKTYLLFALLLVSNFAYAAKITDYPAATTPLAGTEEIPCDQAGTTKKCSTGSIATASNGLTKTASDIALGGTLTGNTKITTTGYSLILGDLTSASPMYYAPGSTGLYFGSNSSIDGFTLIGSSSNANSPAFYCTKSRGTNSVPTAVQSGDSLCQFYWGAWDGTATQNPNYIDSIVVGAVSAGVVPADMVFYCGGSVGGFVECLRLHDNGIMQFQVTNTAGGTTGAQTINKQSFTVNLAAGQSSLDVTDSLVTTNSIVLCSVMTNDTTAVLKNEAVTSGHVVIHTTAAVTAETRVGCVVFNN